MTTGGEFYVNLAAALDRAYGDDQRDTETASADVETREQRNRPERLFGRDVAVEEPAVQFGDGSGIGARPQRQRDEVRP